MTALALPRQSPYRLLVPAPRPGAWLAVCSGVVPCSVSFSAEPSSSLCSRGGTGVFHFDDPGIYWR